MIPPSVRLFTLSEIVLQGAPSESPGYLLNGQVIVNIRVPTQVKLLKVVFQTEQGIRWLSLKRKPKLINDRPVALDDILYAEEDNAAEDNVWGRGSYEFFFQLLVPGSVCETMYTEHKQVSYEVRAVLETDGPLGHAQRRTSVHPIAVKRVPYYGPVWESLANDMVNVSAVWRDQIEMCVFGCSRVQRDGRPVRVKGVVRALEKGFKLTKVGFLLEERTRSRGMSRGGRQGESREGPESTSSIAASAYLRPKTKNEHKGWYGGAIVDQLAFEMELQIPKAYGKIQYDVKHGSVTVSHRLAFVVAVVDSTGRGTSLRLFTPLHIMPHDWADTGEELPSYTDSFADRVLLRSILSQHQCLPNEQYEDDAARCQLQILPLSPPPPLTPLLSATANAEPGYSAVCASDRYAESLADDTDSDSAIATDGSSSSECVRIGESSRMTTLGVVGLEWENAAARQAGTVADS